MMRCVNALDMCMPYVGHCSAMPTLTRNKKLEAELLAMLMAEFPGVSVSVQHSERWNSMCVTFRWEGFAGLLPEERFYRLMQVLPETLCQTKLQGHVWLELAPGESIEAFLKQPRSEDIADRADAIHAGLAEVGFFDKLREAMGSSPEAACQRSFSIAEHVLAGCGYAGAKIREAKLLFIRHSAYCDCQVPAAVECGMSETHSEA